MIRLAGGRTHVRDGRYGERGDDQETWMTRRGSDEAVSRPVPWQLRANHRAERSALVADGDPVFRSVLDGTKCCGIEDRTKATSSRDTYRVSLVIGYRREPKFTILIDFTGDTTRKT